jgi:hypothetical protein
MIYDIWYLIHDIWHMNQNETIWDEMRRENALHTSVITTARDSRDMKAHLACLKSGPSEPHVPSVEGKQLTTSAFQVAQFQTSNYPTFCNVFQTSQLLECSPAEKPFGGKAWLLKVVSLDKLDMGLTCSTCGGLGRAVSEVQGQSDGATDLPMSPTCSNRVTCVACCIEQRVTGANHPPRSARSARLYRLAIRTIAEHRTYLSFGTPKSYWLRHEILQLQPSNLA